jgi:hypothetical protein
VALGMSTKPVLFTHGHVLHSRELPSIQPWAFHPHFTDEETEAQLQKFIVQVAIAARCGTAHL